MTKYMVAAVILAMACVTLAIGIPNRQKNREMPVVPTTRDPRGSVSATLLAEDIDMSAPEGIEAAATGMCSRDMLDMIQKMEDLVSGMVTVVQKLIAQVAGMVMGGANGGYSNDNRGWPEGGEFTSVMKLYQMEETAKNLKQWYSKSQ